MQDELIQLLAGRRGHFQLESGYHGEQWFDLEPLFEQQERLRRFVSELAQRLAAHRINAVCGPMTGGAKLAALVADELEVEYFYTERFAPVAVTGLFPVMYRFPAVQRENVRGKTVAIVDDAISTGSAVRGSYSDLVACGARPVALGALFVLGDTAARFASDNGLALEGIAKLPFSMWKPTECPLCKAGVAVEKVSATV